MDRKLRLKVGERVVLEDHWEFADGIVGTITLPPAAVIALSKPGEWQGCRRIQAGSGGTITSYFVQFDEPHDDGSGDGPYQGGEVDEESLRLLLPGPT